MAKLLPVNSSAGPKPTGNYAQAIQLSSFEQLVFVSGQIPVSKDGTVPVSFGDQCRLVWSNILVQLNDAGMSAVNVVKITTFLSCRDYASENGAVRREFLGSHTPALTVIIADIYDPAWLLEIEVIAAV